MQNGGLSMDKVTTENIYVTHCLCLLHCFYALRAEFLGVSHSQMGETTVLFNAENN